MKKNSLNFILANLLIIFSFLNSFSQVKKNVVSNNSSIKIGNQVWLVKNLNVEKFRNGEVIPQAKSKDDWVRACENNMPIWCFYEFNAVNGSKYGKIYNWYALKDIKGIAPIGYHVPDDFEWQTLCDYLGGIKICGDKLKSESDWLSPFDPSTGSRPFPNSNSSLFTALPGGEINNEADFLGLESQSSFWSSSELDGNGAEIVSLVYGFDETISFNKANKLGGFYVRCIKDGISNEEKIGNQIWSNVNLNTTIFRNGDPIQQVQTQEEWDRAAQKNEPAWCYYNGDANNGAKYGKLYNWFAVNDKRGLSPSGWHIPKIDEFNELTTYFSEDGEKLKGFFFHELNYTVGGFRSVDEYDSFSSLDENGIWWSCSEESKLKSHSLGLDFRYNVLFKNSYKKGYGLSVRCLRD